MWFACCMSLWISGSIFKFERLVTGATQAPADERGRSNWCSYGNVVTVPPGVILVIR